MTLRQFHFNDETLYAIGFYFYFFLKEVLQILQFFYYFFFLLTFIVTGPK